MDANCNADVIAGNLRLTSSRFACFCAVKLQVYHDNCYVWKLGGAVLVVCAAQLGVSRVSSAMLG